MRLPNDEGTDPIQAGLWNERKTMINMNKIQLIAGMGVILLAIFTGCELTNSPPIIQEVNFEQDPALTGSVQTVTAVVEDPEEDLFVITWTVTAGILDKTQGESVRWTAPDEIQDVTFKIEADDRKINGKDSTNRTISVVNNAPVISDFSSSSPFVLLGNSIELSCTAEDPDGEDITYKFISHSDVGTFIHADPTANTATWEAPSYDVVSFSRSYNLIVEVEDVQGYFSQDTLAILVYSESGTAWVVDSGHKTVSKYTSSGDYILTSPHSFTEPVAVAGNTDEFYGAYVADKGTGEVVRIDRLGVSTDSFTDMPNVVDLDIHRASRTLWAICQGNKSLTVYDINPPGQLLKKIYGLIQPNSILINQTSGDVWIADGGHQGIIQLGVPRDANALPDTIAAGSAFLFTNATIGNHFNNPQGLSLLDGLGATLYITDAGHGDVEKLIYISGAYTRTDSIGGFAAPPTQVSVTTEALIWVISTGGSVVHVPVGATSGASPFAVLDYDWVNPHVMTADRVNGDIWIGDNGTHQVVKVVSPDSVAFKISGFDFIEDILVNK